MNVSMSFFLYDRGAFRQLSWQPEVQSLSPSHWGKAWFQCRTLALLWIHQGLWLKLEVITFYMKNCSLSIAIRAAIEQAVHLDGEFDGHPRNPEWWPQNYRLREGRAEETFFSTCDLSFCHHELRKDLTQNTFSPRIVGSNWKIIGTWSISWNLGKCFICSACGVNSKQNIYNTYTSKHCWIFWASGNKNK